MRVRAIIALAILLTALLLIAVQVIVQNRQSHRPEIPDLTWVGDVSAAGILPVDQLKARAQQSIPGKLVGEPVTEAMYIMTLDDFRAVTGSAAANEMQHRSPVFIYHITGSFEDLFMYGMSHFPPDTVFDGVEIVLDATTGELMQMAISPEYASFFDYTNVSAPELRTPIVPPTLIPLLPVDEPPDEPLPLPPA